MSWALWLFRGGEGTKTGNWDADGDALRRDLLGVSNDGIVSSAAIIQGLLTGGATGREAVVGVIALILIGIVGSAVNQYAEAAGERSNILAIIKTEKERLALSPAEEFNELVELYEQKGLSHDLSEKVAGELTAKNALAAQLDAEYDLEEEAPSPWFPWKMGLYAGIAFLIGSVIPLVFLLFLPWDWRGEVTLIAVVVALAISGWIGSFSNHSGAIRAMLRTVFAGLIVLGISNLAGTLVTF